MEESLKHKRRWTDEEIRYLQWNWGPGDMRKVVKHLGRSHIAVEKKAVELKLGGVGRGVKTLRQFSRETGYARSTLEIAASNIGLHFHRTFRGGRRPEDRPRDFAITFEQQEQLIAYLTATRHHKMCFRKDGLMSPAGEWGVGRKPPQCTRCKRKDKPHYAKGQCRPCYNTLIKQSDPARLTRREQRVRERAEKKAEAEAARKLLRDRNRARREEEQEQRLLAKYKAREDLRRARLEKQMRLRDERLRQREAARIERIRVRDEKERRRQLLACSCRQCKDPSKPIVSARRCAGCLALMQRTRQQAAVEREARKRAVKRASTKKPSAPSRKRARKVRGRSQRRAA